MIQRKATFVALIILACLGMSGFFILNHHFDFLQKMYDFSPFPFKRNSSIIMPEANCDQNPPYLVLLVTTTHEQKEARMAIRKTWGQERLIQGKRVVTFFLLGTRITPSPDEASLSEEVTAYKDIIQKDFVDSYFNLTMKTLMGMEWIANFCPQTSYVMKTDTDMFVNTPYLVELLIRKNQTSNFFSGFLKLEDSPIRDINSKWHVSKSEYAGDRYPPFCSGTGYVFSVDVAQKVHNISSTVPFLKLEDVYVGLCLDKLNISLQNLHTNQVFFPSKPLFSVCTYRKLVTSHRVSPSEIILYWESLEKAEREPC